MEFPFSLYVNDLSEIPDNFIKFGDISDFVDNWHAKEDHPVYFLKRRNTLIIQQENVHRGHFFRWFKYWEPLNQLFLRENEGLSNRCRLYLTGINMFERGTPLWAFNLAVYIEKTCIQDMYEKLQIPKIVLGMLYFNFNIPPTLCINDTLLVENENTTIANSSLLKRPLFEWQLNNIQWMLNRENTPVEFDLPILGYNHDSYHLESIDQHIVFNRARTFRNNSQSVELIDIDKLERQKLVLQGGILADEVGLGKTFSIIGLIQANPLKTLIVCPARLCKQWAQEIREFSSLKAWIVADSRQYKYFEERKDTYDVIITPSSIFTNQRSIDIDGGMQTKTWDRLVIDEAHEFFGKIGRGKKAQQVRSSFYTMRTKYTWLVTGTPTTCKDTWINYIDIICKSNIDPNAFRVLRTDIYKVVQQTYIRNTKSSLKNKITIPPAEFEDRLLDQTLVEKYIYQSALGNVDEMIQLCTHVLVSERCFKILGNDPIPLSEIHTQMIQYNKRVLSRYTRKAEILLEKKQQLLEEDYHEKFTKYQSILNQARSRIKIFKDLENKLKESCAICMEEFKDVIPVVGKCGHLFCSGCLTELFERETRNQPAKCAICREHMRKEDLLIVQTETPQHITDNEKYGTKMTELISYLNHIVEETTDNRIIIFSQFDKMLQMIAKVLEEQNILHVVVKGSAFQSAAQIRRFKIDRDIRIIMLSSEKASSGLNLTEATHIALVDTVNGDQESVRAIEEQAIGRSVRLGQTKQVKVTRFVMKNTIEYDNYVKNILSG